MAKHKCISKSGIDKVVQKLIESAIAKNAYTRTSKLILRAAKGAQQGNFNRNYNQLKLIYTSGDSMKILNGANKA